MTEGIIQRIIIQYCIDIEINQAITKKEKQFAISRISSLEQELIEEITHYLNDRERYNTGLRNYLIGDNP